MYVIFKENSYLAIFAKDFLNLEPQTKIFTKINIFNFEYYLPDFLWALSLSCGLHIIFNPKTIGSLYCTTAITGLGFTFELMQYTKIINGTGDIIDIILYLLAGITVNLINLKRRR